MRAGSYGGLTPTSAAAVKTLGMFADGTPAVTLTSVAKGQIVRLGWLPGVSYWFSHPKGSIGNRPRSDTIRQIIAGLATGIAGIEPPVTASATRVETPLLLSPVITNQQTCVHDLSHLRLRVNQLPQLPLLYR
jgi:hypothetical protein